MVNVTNGAHVNVGLGTFKFSFRHDIFLSFQKSPALPDTINQNNS
ncbi:hypothetical protein C8J23_12571 [Shewanella chilikensis]|uniref:Uncharacterized protein n=1 Tax=Shewanella chilikensis TaxID=558541 RepID=A0ABX5PKX2_9GAMM|nr:hypothetical protein C8J23_12571 [Shewanella chilikensis]